MKSRIIYKLFGIIMMMLTVVNIGCYYDQVLPPCDDCKCDDSLCYDSISFTLNIQPIFTASCDNCHPPISGLDLSDGEAYNSINDPKYINRATPVESLIYTKPLNTGNHGGKYTTFEASLVLKWIEEGALNN